jgi:hypothetical protein
MEEKGEISMQLQLLSIGGFLAALIALVAIFVGRMHSADQAFIQALTRQREVFVQELRALASRISGPDTGAVPTARPSTGPTKPPTTGGRNVRTPTKLP